jgi:hypothetical protein
MERVRRTNSFDVSGTERLGKETTKGNAGAWGRLVAAHAAFTATAAMVVLLSQLPVSFVSLWRILDSAF